jgi:hypothetical protein
VLWGARRPEREALRVMTVECYGFVIVKPLT